MARPQGLSAVPRELVERKPRHGEACNNCGLCCFASKCDLGRRLFGPELGPCPALRFDEHKRSSCNVANNPSEYFDANADDIRAAVLLVLYAGLGCTMRINGEQPNWQFDARLDALTEQQRAEFDEARKLLFLSTQWRMP